MKRIYYYIIFLLLIISFNNALSQTIGNRQNVVGTAVAIASTPNTPNSYQWQEVTNLTQGLDISVDPAEKASLYIQLTNAYLNFYRETAIMTSLHIKYDEGSWIEIFNNQTKTETGWIASPFTTLGHHTIAVDWKDMAGIVYSRDYDVYIVPNCNKLYKDNYGNTLACWSGSGNVNSVVISEGYDPYNFTYPEYLRSKGSQLIQPLQQGGINVFVLNYKYNSQDMRNSAAIYRSAINYVSALKGHNEIVASGVSMGGVIARYALAKAESEGSALPVKTFVSIDAPQQGAVLSASLQDFMKDELSNYFQTHAIQSYASKQLLYYNAYENLHDSFYNELNSLNNGQGYPQLTKNVGVSFSNGTANPGSGTWITVTYEPLVGPDISMPFVLSAEERVAGSYLPGDMATSERTPVIFGVTYVTRTAGVNPTFVPYNSSLDIRNGTSKFPVRIQANSNYFHDVFPSEVIDPLLKEIFNPYVVKITRNFEFDSPEVLATQYITRGTSPIVSISTPATITKNGRQYFFANWSDGVTANPRNITYDITVSAVYKMPFKSTNANAFASSGQRKIAKASYDDSWVHMVYESMGQIWYKYSMDNGATWSNEKLVGEGSSPSIDAYTDSHIINPYDPYIPTAVIVYQSVDEYEALIHMTTYVRGALQSDMIVDTPWWLPEGGNPPTYNYMPIVSAGWNYRLVVWKPSASLGLYYMYGVKNAAEEWVWSTTSKQLVPGTNAKSVNASIATDPAYYQNGYLVYQQDTDYNSAYGFTPSYVYLKSFFTQPLSWGSAVTIASNKEAEYYYRNHHPCVTVAGNRMPYVTWIQYHPVTYANSALLKYQVSSSAWSQVYSYSFDEDELLQTHIATVGGSSLPTFMLGMVSDYGNNQYVKGANINSVYTTNTSGKQLQVMGGASASAAKIVSFYNTSLPYYFQFSGGLAKENETSVTFNDRTLHVLSKNMLAQFGIGDITLGDTQIKFNDLDDTLEAAALNKHENFIVSEEFALNNSSSLAYKLITGISNYDPLLTAKMLGNENLKLSVELIDARTGKVFKNLSELTYNKNVENMPYSEKYYKFQNIGFDGTAKLRIGISYNLADKDAKYSIHKSAYTNGSQKNYNIVDTGEEEPVNSYALTQNYPNPFNPSTVINYAIPQDGLVSLKVYNILGQEVATLVDEFKSAGRYNVTFNASQLSTGVYIYRLTAGDYVSVKKMSFIK